MTRHDRPDRYGDGQAGAWACGDGVDVDASCVDAPGLPWTADAWTVAQTAQVSMRRVCAGCPVRALCDAYAVPTTVVAGFWAGQHRGPLGDPDRPMQLPLFDDLRIAG